MTKVIFEGKEIEIVLSPKAQKELDDMRTKLEKEIKGIKIRC